LIIFNETVTFSAFPTCRGLGIDAIVLLFLALLALEGEEVDSSKKSSVVSGRVGGRESSSCDEDVEAGPANPAKRLYSLVNALSVAYSLQIHYLQSSLTEIT
jgi:hypothetical protein